MAEVLHDLEGRGSGRRFDVRAVTALAIAVVFVAGLVAAIRHGDGDRDRATNIAVAAPGLVPPLVEERAPEVSVPETLPVTVPEVTVPPLPKVSPTTAVPTPKPAVAPSASTVPPAPKPAVKPGPALTEGGLYLASPDGGGVRRVVSGLVQGFTVSPDGSRLAFGRDGHLWMVNADGSGLTRVLTSEPDRYVCCGIHWSPRGDLVAFIASDGGPNESLWLMTPDGSDVRRIADRPASGTPLAWSRDGSKLAFVQVGLHLYDVAGGELRTLWDKPVSPMVAWSGDDSRLAFLGGEYGEMIDVIGVDGTGHRRLAGTDKIPGFLTWRASSDEIFYSDRYKFELWSVGADSGGPRSVMGGLEAAIPAWSGDRVALQVRDGYLGGSGHAKTVLEVAGGDLSHRVRVAESTSKAMLVGARWSFDGSVIAVRAITPPR